MKNLHICFSNFKYCLPTIAFTPPSPSPDSQHRRCPSPTSALFVKNFNSLYDLTTTDHNSLYSDHLTTTAAPNHNSASDVDPDFSAVSASNRFFVSSPGESNSIVNSLPNSPTKSDSIMVPGGFAIQTYSPDPYADFRRSMQEMFEAHKSSSSSSSSTNDNDPAEDWDYLQKLLHCYLSLNPKRNHKFITLAFADLVRSQLLIPPPPRPPHQIDQTWS